MEAAALISAAKTSEVLIDGASSRSSGLTPVQAGPSAASRHTCVKVLLLEAGSDTTGRMLCDATLAMKLPSGDLGRVHTRK